MNTAEPKGPIGRTEPAIKQKKLEWLGQGIIDLMAERAPSLLVKLSDLRQGQDLSLTGAEMEFFEGLIAQNQPGISLIVTGIAGQLWGANIVTWRDGKMEKRGNIVTELWRHFLPRGATRNSNLREVLKFFLDTSREDAEAQISKWQEFANRRELKLVE